MKDEPAHKTHAQKTGGELKSSTRRSALLLFGRIMSLTLNLLTQVLTIRYLSKIDYGLFSYVLVLVGLASSINKFGLDRTAGRFSAIYEQENKLPALAGTIIFSIGSIVAIGAALISLTAGFQGLITGTLVDNKQAMGLLIIMIALAPVNALDAVLVAFLAAFGKAKAIFFRKNILRPGLKLIAVSITIAMSGNLRFLAASHIIAGVFGLLLYAALVPRILREHRVLHYFHPRRYTIDYKSLLMFSLPTFISDIIFSLRLALAVILVEAYYGKIGVAEYQSVFPVARINTVVIESFSLMFIPMASRLFAKKEMDTLHSLHTHTTLWIAILSFPVLAISIGLAEPVVVLLLGEKYASSASVFMILALGIYIGSSMGLTIRTLRALGKVKALFYIDIGCVLVVIVTAFIAVPPLGSVGGAIATAISMTFQTLMSSIALWKYTNNNPLPWQYAKIYLLVLGCIFILFLPTTLNIDSSWISVFLVTATIVLVIFTSRRLLQVADMFPEVRKLPTMIKWILGASH